MELYTTEEDTSAITTLTEQESPSLTTIPTEVLLEILKKLNKTDLNKLGSTCIHFYNFISEAYHKSMHGKVGRLISWQQTQLELLIQSKNKFKEQIGFSMKNGLKTYFYHPHLSSGSNFVAAIGRIAILALMGLLAKDCYKNPTILDSDNMMLAISFLITCFIASLFPLQVHRLWTVPLSKNSIKEFLSLYQEHKPCLPKSSPFASLLLSHRINDRENRNYGQVLTSLEQSIACVKKFIMELRKFRDQIRFVKVTTLNPNQFSDDARSHLNHALNFWNKLPSVVAKNDLIVCEEEYISHLETSELGEAKGPGAQ